MPQDPVNFKECSLALEKMLKQLDAMNAILDNKTARLISEIDAMVENMAKRDAVLQLDGEISHTIIAARDTRQTLGGFSSAIDNAILNRSFQRPFYSPYSRIRPIIFNGRISHASEDRE